MQTITQTATVSARIDFKMYHEWIAQGRSFNDIRVDLAQKGYSEAEISRLIRTIDNDISTALLRKSRNKKAMGIIIMGAFLFLTGSGITLYTFFAGQSSYILCYGAIISGLAMVFSGMAKRE